MATHEENQRNENAAKTSLCTGTVAAGLLALAPVAAPGIVLGTILGGAFGALFGYASADVHD